MPIFGEEALQRARTLLTNLGNPEEDLRIIHIAGTSGKGSTAHLLATALHACGKTVGLSTSPHLISVTERLQINGERISEEHLASLLQKIEAAGEPTYFERYIAASYLWFSERAVDYAVMETGMGGRFDATNTVLRKDKVALLTKIGYDHMEFLGTTLPEIAGEKAAIIHAGNVAFAIEQEASVLEVFQERAESVGANLTVVSPHAKIASNLLGEHQRENEALALTALTHLSERDGWEIAWSKVEHAWKNLSIPGRVDVKNIQEKTVVFDGAHNTQKMSALTHTLREQFPNARFHFVLSFKQDKDITSLLNLLVPIASSFIATEFTSQLRDMAHAPVPANDIRQLLQTQGKEVQIVPNALTALKEGLALLSEPNDILVVTGSFYLLGDLYPHLPAL